MSVAETLARYDLSHSTIHEHGFAQNMHDYRLLVELEGRTPGRYIFLFRNCIQVEYNTPEPELSIENVLTELSGWQPSPITNGGSSREKKDDSIPVWRYVEGSSRAEEWSLRRNLPMHEITVSTRLHLLSVVFHDLEVTEAEGG